MAMFYGNSVANYVTQGEVMVYEAWIALQVGSTPHSGRFAVRITSKGDPGQALALAYANQDASGSFTAPTTGTRYATIYPGGRTWIEPLSDKVTLYGRLVKKAGSTRNSVPVVITEFS